jgi:hypothetical protein
MEKGDAKSENGGELGKKINKQCQLTAKKGEKQYFEHSELDAPDSIASKLNIFA